MKLAKLKEISNDNNVDDACQNNRVIWPKIYNGVLDGQMDGMENWARNEVKRKANNYLGKKSSGDSWNNSWLDGRSGGLGEKRFFH